MTGNGQNNQNTDTTKDLLTSAPLDHSTRALAGRPEAMHVRRASAPARIRKVFGLTLRMMGALVAVRQKVLSCLGSVENGSLFC